MEWTMEWTDGMEHQLTKIAKLTSWPRWSWKCCLAITHFCTWTRLCFGGVDVRWCVCQLEQA